MSNETPNPPKRELGLFAMMGVLVGGGCLLITLLGVINTAFDLHWALRVYGATMDLPDSYEICAGLAAAGILIIGLSLFGSYVTGKFKDAKGKPLVRVGIVAGAVLLLAVMGWGLQRLAIKDTYGSMLAYYATDGDPEDVKAELAKGPDREALDRAVGRAAQYDNVAALRLLLEAGADLRNETSPMEYRHCALGRAGPEFIAVALEHGVGPDSCPNSEALVWTTVNSDHDDATAAKIVTMLVKAGWSAAATPEYSNEPAADVARRRQMTATLTALGAAAD